MTYKIKALIVLFMIIITLGITSCSKEVIEVPIVSPTPTYKNYYILGMNEEQYIAEIKDMVLLIYAPTGKVSRDTLVTYCKKYMTDECAEIFVGTGDGTEINKNITCTVNETLYEYQFQQEDGVARIITSISIDDTVRLQKFTLEMKINDNQKIFKVIAY